MTVTSSVSTIALRTFPIFQGLGDDRLAAVARCAMMRRVPRGAAVVHEGDRTDFVYFVLTGSLKVMVSDEDGREVILSILGQGEMFGEMGVLDDSPRSASGGCRIAVRSGDHRQADFKRSCRITSTLAWHIMCNLTQAVCATPTARSKALR
jgi:CRP/FNR family cyclic AMP-dependent transcriptional regulator